MFRVQLTLVLLVGFVCTSWQASSPTDPHYIAGVVEFRPTSSLLPSNIQVNKNVAAYLQIISSEQANETDIIIFPEATLSTVDQLSYVPDPLDSIAPCDRYEYAEFLHKLSCQARTFRKYIVINLFEKDDCTPELQAVRNDPRPCAQNGLSIYSTNVVFDRSGVVISRYRKVNLYHEPLNVTHIAEYGHFETDFGVHFGHFISFDILMYTPAVELANWGITDFILTTKWVPESTFITAAQTQQFWSFSYDVNLLAASTSYPSLGITGTGAYVGKNGSLVSVLNTMPERGIYVVKVPKKWFIRSDTSDLIDEKRTPNHLNGVLVQRDPEIDTYITVPANPLPNSRLCYNGLCCDFASTTSKRTPPVNATRNSYHYRLAEYQGQPQVNSSETYKGNQKNSMNFGNSWNFFRFSSASTMFNSKYLTILTAVTVFIMNLRK